MISRRRSSDLDTYNPLCWVKSLLPPYDIVRWMANPSAK